MKKARKHNIKNHSSIAVLVSGGLDSAVLLSWAASRYGRVYPLFVRAGLRWEDAERRALEKFIRLARLPRMQQIIELSLDCKDLAGKHWAYSKSQKHPGSDEAWEDYLYLPGRNLLLLSKAAVFFASRGIGDIAIGTLKGNPFPDASLRFFKLLERTLSLGLKRKLSLKIPFRTLSKEAVIRLGSRLPLEHTLSCSDPGNGRGQIVHCGTCSKCIERRDAFIRGKIADSTKYRILQAQG